MDSVKNQNNRTVKVSETTFKAECGQEIVVTKYATFDYCNKCHKMHIFRVKGVYEYVRENDRTKFEKAMKLLLGYSKETGRTITVKLHGK